MKDELITSLIKWTIVVTTFWILYYRMLEEYGL